MKKFSFRLQTVLEMREKKLEDKRREMAVVIAKLNEQLEVLESFTNKQEDVKNYLEFIYNDGKVLNITEVTSYKDYLGKVVTDIKRQEKEIEQTRYLLKFKQLEVTEALKAVKVLEKLKETQEKKFYRHYEHMQAKEIDDIATTRYVREKEMVSGKR